MTWLEGSRGWFHADRFSWAGDRSTDSGKTWVKNSLQIEARRLGPPRTMGPLTRVKETAGAKLF